MDISLCCLTALPWLAGTEQAVSKGASIYFIPMGHVERADLPRNVDGGLVVAPGSLGGVAETHVLRAPERRSRLNNPREATPQQAFLIFQRGKGMMLPNSLPNRLFPLLLLS